MFENFKFKEWKRRSQKRIDGKEDMKERGRPSGKNFNFRLKNHSLILTFI